MAQIRACPSKCSNFYCELCISRQYISIYFLKIPNSRNEIWTFWSDIRLWIDSKQAGSFGACLRNTSCWFTRDFQLKRTGANGVLRGNVWAPEKQCSKKRAAAAGLPWRCSQLHYVFRARAVDHTWRGILAQDQNGMCILSTRNAFVRRGSNGHTSPSADVSLRMRPLCL